MVACPPCVLSCLTLWSCVISSSLAGSALKRLCLGKEHSSRNYRVFYPLSASIAWALLWLVRIRVSTAGPGAEGPAGRRVWTRSVCPPSVGAAGPPPGEIAALRHTCKPPWLLEFVHSCQFTSNWLSSETSMYYQSLIGSFSKTVGMSISFKC